MYYQQGKCFHGCLRYGWYCQKFMQFGIFVFVEVQDRSFRGNLLCNKCDGDYHHNIHHYSIICSFTKNASKFAPETNSKIFCLKFLKEQNDFSKTPQSISVFQIPTRSKSSDRVFLTKLKTITACFEHDIFHNNLKDNIMDKPILTNIAGCYQNRNLLQIFSFSWM